MAAWIFGKREVNSVLLFHVCFSANVQFFFFLTSASLEYREVVALLFYHTLHSKCFNSVMG